MAQAGRRPGNSNTREAVLAAARNQFSAKGYQGATIRGIAAEAGVNAAMVHHFFGSKEAVFGAALRVPVDPQRVVGTILDGPREQIGERLARMFLGFWQDTETRAPFLALLRSVTSDDRTAALFKEFVGEAVFSRVSEALGVPRLRLNLAMTQMVGLAIGRFVIGVEPLREADTEEVVELVAPVIQYYLTGTGVDPTIHQAQN
ncbi:TetR family transcriptional regulator [Tamaricihabitans halophyticus]|uniref:TetR family transcriptional regulator n=1 Tax=Tamaricihabitans halophyticus TaxID=1262583 RepID=A0A4R2QFP0_9PSEU|nr:TetR family transcriptional regulator [Tamaricihabitans halophyticus]TCP47960.1 TetR family transcriptional regulator [Tamaricihabitans halophyticus]